MINIIDKKNCCGCEACVQACPKHCISFNEDAEGFRYPMVDVSMCVECGACERTCPVLHQSESRHPIIFYAAKCLDESVRLASSSGGIFTLLAEEVIRQGGVVFGARFNEYWEVEHGYADTLEGIVEFRTSKYVQSRVGDCFRQAKGFLKQGRKVLFSGTPCQIAALKLFLRRNYDNLLTVDVICHGVPSPKVWRMYLEALKDNNNDGAKIERITFRDKRIGWKKFSFTLTLAKFLADDKKNVFQISHTFSEDPFMKVFLANINLRPSCFLCPDKNGKSGADITLGDFWGIERSMPDFDDDKGGSLVILNTNQGVEAFSALPAESRDVSDKIALSANSAYSRSVIPHSNRSRFFRKLCLENVNIINLMNNATRPPLHIKAWHKLKRGMKRILKKR